MVLLTSSTTYIQTQRNIVYLYSHERGEFESKYAHTEITKMGKVKGTIGLLHSIYIN